MSTSPAPGEAMRSAACSAGSSLARITGSLAADRAAAGGASASRAAEPSLRRAIDWRFVLPGAPDQAFRLLALLGAPAGVAQRVVQEGMAERVTEALPVSELADAVIVLHGVSPSSTDVAGALAPGGVVYWEVDRRNPSTRSLTPGRLHGRMLEAGLRPVGGYWIRPDLRGRQVYVPVDTRAALRWYLDSLPKAGLARQRVRARIVRALAALGISFERHLRCFALTAVTEPTRSEPPAILQMPELPAAVRDAHVRALVLAGGADDFDRVVLLPFAPGAREPIAVLKLARLATRNRDIENEQSALRRIRRKLDAPLARSVPLPLGAARCGPLVVGAESYVRGRALAVGSSSRGFSARSMAEYRAAAAWLARFHRRAQTARPTWGNREVEQWVNRPLAAYARALGLSSGEQTLFGRTRRQAFRLRGTTLPIVWQHGAFTARNICSSEGNIGVIDWECAEPGLPLVDLLYFSLQWARSTGAPAGLDRGAVLVELFCTSRPASTTSAIVRRAIEEYARALGIDIRFVPIALVVLLVVHALGRYDRALATDAATVDPRTENEYVAYLATLARHVDPLFDSYKESTLDRGGSDAVGA